MKIQLMRVKLPGLAATVAAGALLLASASHGTAAPQVGGPGVKPPGPVILVGKAPGGGRHFWSPKTFQSPPGPNVRDHRKGGSNSTSSAQGGVLVGGKEGKVRARVGCSRGGGCPSDRAGKNWSNVPKGSLRDHRSK